MPLARASREVSGTANMRDDFILNNDDGEYIILDFEDGTDKINLSNYQKTNDQNLLNDIDFSDLTSTQQGNDVKISGFDNNDNIIIRDMLLNGLSEDDFIF